MATIVPRRIRLFTPRKAAWGLVIVGIGWFVYASPKTPLEFFDAGLRDRQAHERRMMDKYEQIDPVAAAAAGQAWEFFSTCARLDRIALLYDLAHNPQSVQQRYYDIVLGAYTPDANTDKTLRETDEQYRSLAKELQDRKADMKAKSLFAAVNQLQKKAQEDRYFQTTLGVMEMDATVLRQFQRSLFWPEKH